MSELDEQKAVVRWAKAAEVVDSRLELLFAIPNGGKRSQKTGARMSAEGVKAGVPDLFLPVVIREHEDHGLFIEMKVGKGRTSNAQAEWIDALRLQGYRVEVCRSAGEAIRLIENYLGMK